MSATYESSLPSDLDWVRFLIGDTDLSNARLQDEEITALLANEINNNSKARKYLAAANALTVLQLKWTSAGEGLLEKEVDDLRLRWQGSISIGNNTITDRIKELRRIGNRLLLNRSRIFRAL